MRRRDDKRPFFAGNLAIKTDLDRPGDALLVVFGRSAQGIAMPPFDFSQVVQELPAKLVFFRDVSQTWFHGDLLGVGCGLGDVAKSVGAIRRQCGTKRLVCLGKSMGGYAALAIGSLTRADVVLAFSPQTYLTRWLQYCHGDHRARPQLAKLRKVGKPLPKSLDLKRFLIPPGYGQAHIFSDRNFPIDLSHARRLENTPKTTVHWFDEDAHDLIKKLHRKGEFLRILFRACSPAAMGI